jgi:hypothetical protein
LVLITVKYLFTQVIPFYTNEVFQLQRIQQFQVNSIEYKSTSCFLYFKSIKNGSFLIDVIEYETSFGLTGKLLDKIFIKNHISKLLLHRNEIIKQYAETTKWKEILTQIK